MNKLYFNTIFVIILVPCICNIVILNKVVFPNIIEDLENLNNSNVCLEKTKEIVK